MANTGCLRHGAGRYLLILALATAWLPQSGRAASIQFQQGGWSGSGPLYVSADGNDADNDGALFLTELTAFHAIWTTPDGTVTSWSLPDIESDGFTFFDFDDYVIFARNPMYSLTSTAFGGEWRTSVFDQLLFPVDSTVSAPSAIPEPGSWSLFPIGAVAIVAARRLRSGYFRRGTRST